MRSLTGDAIPRPASKNRDARVSNNTGPVGAQIMHGGADERFSSVVEALRDMQDLGCAIRVLFVACASSCLWRESYYDGRVMEVIGREGGGGVDRRIDINSDTQRQEDRHTRMLQMRS